MSIRTKIDFSGITSDNIVTSDNKKYIHEDDEIFNSLKDEIAACENAQVQTELATLQILEIKEQTKVIANEAIDTATERAESAAENAENAQALAKTAAINALEAERNVTEFSETFAKLDGDNAFTGDNNFTGNLELNGKLLLNGKEIDSVVSGHNVGEQWISMDGIIPMGGLPFLGQTVSKETYSELYNWVESNGRFKTETEWQSLYTANNGNVSFYAKVDDNTFRLPSFKGYLKANESAGGYTKEGLPNITGAFNASAAVYSLGSNSGAFSKTYINGTARTQLLADAGGDLYVRFDAANSNPIYGNSTHVTPETNTIIVGVYAFNTIINPSNLDVESLRLDTESLRLDTESLRTNVESLRLDNLNYVTKANGEISTNLTVTAGRDAIFRKNGARLYLCTFDDSYFPGGFILRAPKDENCTSYVDLQGHSNGVLTWGGKPIITLVASWRSGDNWYRKYSDGWIEQGGRSAIPSVGAWRTINLHTAFSDTNYNILLAGSGTTMTTSATPYNIRVKSDAITTTSFKISDGSKDDIYAYWYACGY